MEGGSAAARKVMVVVDPTRESAGALQYALSHAIVENDTLILFHVENPNGNAWKNPFVALFRKPSNGGGAATSNYYSCTSVVVEGGGGGGGEVDFLDAMKEACMIAQPKLKVVVVKAEMAEGKDKGSVILAKSAAYKIDLLIIGHKRSLSNTILGVKRGGSVRDTAEYLILNSKCTCVAVQKKGQNGGYLLSSKKHKNFWLLA